MVERTLCRKRLHDLRESNLKPHKDKNGKTYMICWECRLESQRRYDEGRKGAPRRHKKKVKQC